MTSILTARPRLRRPLCVVLALSSSACAEKPAAASPPKAPNPATSAAPAPATNANGDKACAIDEDCARPWNPSMNVCGTTQRCFGQACIDPPAMTGVANAQTGRVRFDTPGGERTYQVEVAQTGFETQRGLMCRDAMKHDWGMLFLLEANRIQQFWMKNTLIPLDLVYIRTDWTVAGVVAEAPPLNLQGRGVSEPTQYVLELSSGEAKRAGIAAGAKVRFYAPRAE